MKAKKRRDSFEESRLKIYRDIKIRYEFCRKRLGKSEVEK